MGNDINLMSKVIILVGKVGQGRNYHRQGHQFVAQGHEFVGQGKVVDGVKAIFPTNILFMTLPKRQVTFAHEIINTSSI